MADNSINTTEKGNRHENQAKDILKRIYGAGVEKVDAWGNHDPFGFIDLIAIHKNKPVKFVQIKTNNFTAKDKKKYIQKTRNMPNEHAVFEVWVRIDREGWEIYELNDDSFSIKYEIPVCNVEEAREMYYRLENEN